MLQNIELRKIKHALEWEYINTCIQGSQYANMISQFHVDSSAFFLLSMLVHQESRTFRPFPPMLVSGHLTYVCLKTRLE